MWHCVDDELLGQKLAAAVAVLEVGSHDVLPEVAREVCQEHRDVRSCAERQRERVPLMARELFRRAALTACEVERREIKKMAWNIIKAAQKEREPRRG